MKRSKWKRWLSGIMISALLISNTGVAAWADDNYLDDLDESMSVIATNDAEYNVENTDATFFEEDYDIMPDLNDEKSNDEISEDPIELLGDRWEILDSEENVQINEIDVAEDINENASLATLIISFVLPGVVDDEDISGQDIIIAKKEIKKEISENEESYTFSEIDVLKAFEDAISENVLPEEYKIASIQWDEDTLNSEEEEEISAQEVIVLKGESAELTVLLAEEDQEADEEAEEFDSSISLPAMPQYSIYTARRGMLKVKALSTIPSDAAIFFDAKGENPSFSTVQYWDTYSSKLFGNATNNANGLVLASSTDGAVVDQNKLQIDFETGPDIKSYPTKTDFTNEQAGKRFNIENYSDGNFTIVGWGGNFRPSEWKTQIEFKLTSLTSGKTATDLANYLTVELYDNLGDCIVQASVSNGKLVGGAESDGNKSRVYTIAIPNENCSNTAHHGGDGNRNKQVRFQGIKFKFDKVANDTHTYNQGSLIISDVYAKIGNENVNFAPFKEYNLSNENGAFWNEYKIGGAIYPYLRPAEEYGNYQGSKILPGKSIDRDGTTAGYNIAHNIENYGWHLWTMSTSDGNIVSGTANDRAGRDALQIKYSHNTNHTTQTSLTAANGKSGEWLAVTVWAPYFDSDHPVAIRLNDGTSIPLTQFSESMSDRANKVDANALKREYRTIYYHIGKDVNLTKVSFDFSNVSETTIAERMFVENIYLVDPKLELVKTVDRDLAAVSDELEYTLTVNNAKDIEVKNITVTDTALDLSKVTFEKFADIPENTTASETDGKITWNIPSLAGKGSITLKFIVKVKTDEGVLGLTIVNSAKITKYGNENVDIPSNTVETQIVEPKIFYNEAGREVILPIEVAGSGTGTAKSVTLTGIENTGTWEDKWTASTGDTVQLGQGENIISLSTTGGGINIHSVKLSNSTGPKEITVNGSNVYGADGYDESNQDVLNTGYIKLYNGAKREGNSNDNFHVAQMDKSVEGQNAKADFIFRNLAAGTYTLSVTYATETNASMQASYTEVEASGTKKLDSVVGKTKYTAKADVRGDKKSIDYQSTAEPGIDNLIVNFDNDDTEQLIRIYNYQVYSKIYVLDYGLPVNLIGGDNGLLNDAVVSLKADGATGRFVGMRQEPREESAVLQLDNASYADYSIANYANAVTVDAETKTATWTRSDKQGDVEYTTGDTLAVKYTPTQFMSDLDKFCYGYQVVKNGSEDASLNAENASPVMQETIKVMPANVVYYEDNFAAITIADNNDGKAVKGDHTGEQSNISDSVHGYDNAYVADSEDSNGGSVIINTAAKYDGVNYVTGKTDVISFKFKGTGFEVVGRSTTESGIVTVTYKNLTTNETKAAIVDTYFANGNLFQTPVLSIQGLQYAEYEVKIGLTASSRGDTFYLDGIRIYQPAFGNSEITENYGDETNVHFQNIRKMLLGDGEIEESIVRIADEDDPDTSFEFVIGLNAENRSAALVKVADGQKPELFGYTFTEAILAGNSSSGLYSEKLNDYLSKGPNNEVYLGTQDAVAFYVEPTGTDAGVFQIEARKVSIGGDGEDAEFSKPALRYVTKNNFAIQTLTSIETGTAMYYTIPLENCIKFGNKYLVIVVGTSTANDCISVSNVKYSGYEISCPKVDGTYITLNTSASEEQDAQRECNLKVDKISVTNPSVKNYATVTVEVSGYDENKINQIALNIYLDSAATADVRTPAKVSLVSSATRGDDGTVKIAYQVKMPTKAQKMRLNIEPKYAAGEDESVSANITEKIINVR